MDFGFRILDFGFWILDFEPNFGCYIIYIAVHAGPGRRIVGFQVAFKNQSSFFSETSSWNPIKIGAHSVGVDAWFS